MRPVSEAFLKALTGSHALKVRARVVTDFQNGTDPTGELLPNIIGGDVQADATAPIRSTLNLMVEGPWESRWDGLLTPYGNELFVERGMEFDDGVIEWMPLGFYRITDVEQDDAPDGPIRIAGSDRMLGVIEFELTKPRAFTANHTLRQVIELLVLSVYPDATIGYDFDPDAVALGRDVIIERDRFAFLRDLAAAHSKLMFWDYKGDLQFQHAPNPTAPVWTVKAGRNGVLVNLARNMSREGVFNAVVAEGEGADSNEPVRGIAFDADRYSPTYWRGRFGKRPRFYSSPLLTNREQARAAAESELRKTLGRPFQMTFTSVPNSALEVYDPVKAQTSEGYQVHVIEQVTIPLTADESMTATTRELSALKIETEGL